MSYYLSDEESGQRRNRRKRGRNCVVNDENSLSDNERGDSIDDSYFRSKEYLKGGRLRNIVPHCKEGICNIGHSSSDEDSAQKKSVNVNLMFSKSKKVQSSHTSKHDDVYLKNKEKLKDRKSRKIAPCKEPEPNIGYSSSDEGSAQMESELDESYSTSKERVNCNSMKSKNNYVQSSHTSQQEDEIHLIKKRIDCNLVEIKNTSPVGASEDEKKTVNVMAQHKEQKVLMNIGHMLEDEDYEDFDSDDESEEEIDDLLVLPPPPF